MRIVFTCDLKNIKRKIKQIIYQLYKKSYNLKATILNMWISDFCEIKLFTVAIWFLKATLVDIKFLF